MKTDNDGRNSARAIDILAHRGGCAGEYPDNTIAAFREGLARGADVVEMDVHLTSDGEVVVAHDPYIVGARGEEVVFAETSFVELSTYVGDHNVPSDERPAPTLSAVMEAFPTVRSNIDLKSEDPELGTAVVELVRRHGATARTTVASCHTSALERFRSIAPEVATSAHPDEVKQFLLGTVTRRKPTSPARVLQVPIRHGILPIATRAFVTYAHRYGYFVHVWTVNDPRVAVRLAKIGVDGIVTDDVGRIKDALDTFDRSRRSSI